MSQGKSSKTGERIFGILAFIAVIMLIRGWNYTPWVQKSKTLKSVKVEMAEYDAGSSQLNVRIRNHSMYDMKDVELECSLYGPSGTLLESHDITLYENLDGGTTVESAERVDVSSIQASRAKCSVDNATVFETVYGGQEYRPGVDPVPSRPAAN